MSVCVIVVIPLGAHEAHTVACISCGGVESMRIRSATPAASAGTSSGTSAPVAFPLIVPPSRTSFCPNTSPWFATIPGGIVILKASVGDPLPPAYINRTTLPLPGRSASITGVPVTTTGALNLTITASVSPPLYVPGFGAISCRTVGVPAGTTGLAYAMFQRKLVPGWENTLPRTPPWVVNGTIALSVLLTLAMPRIWAFSILTVSMPEFAMNVEPATAARGNPPGLVAPSG